MLRGDAREVSLRYAKDAFLAMLYISWLRRRACLGRAANRKPRRFP